MSGIDDHWNVWSQAQRILILGCGQVGMRVWWRNICSKAWPGFLSRLNMRQSFGTETRLFGRTTSSLPSHKVARQQTPWQPFDWPKNKGHMYLVFATWWGRALPVRRMPGPIHMPVLRSESPSTKAFTAQVAVLTVLAMHVGRRLGQLDDALFMRLMTGLDNIPGLVQKVLERATAIESIAHQFADADNALYLGRGFQFPVALEGVPEAQRNQLPSMPKAIQLLK